MPITVVVGGQYGGEGKGLIVASLTAREKIDILVKVGGPNSAHSYTYGGKNYYLRMLPSGVSLGPSLVIFPAGCLIYPKQLFAEMDKYEYMGEIAIDYNAGIIEETHILEQNKDDFYVNVGSTLTGTGYASSYRNLRRLKTAKDISELAPFLTNVQELLVNQYKQGKSILIEGVQGFGLSNYHGDYPYVSSRDNTVNALMSQVGLGRKWVDRIILTVKCFPTRNIGGEGELKGEFDQKFIDKYKNVLLEYGGGSYNSGNQPRRVGLFSWDLLKRAIYANSPDYIAITGMDKLSSLLHEEDIFRYYGSCTSFIDRIEAFADTTVLIEGWGNEIEKVKFNYI